MNNQREPNPLRPYYIPPSIGLPPDAPSNSTGPNLGRNGLASTKPSFTSSAREMFSDLDYSDYLSDSSPSASDTIKNLMDQALWKYTSVLMAQPLEVAKTILQVYVVQDEQDGTVVPEDKRKRQEGYREDRYDDVRL